MGTSGFVAQAFGADDIVEVRTILSRSLLLAGLFSLLLVLLQYPLRHLMFWVLEGSQALEAIAAQYYAVRIWSAPATLANYALIGCLIALQNTRAVLAMQLILNGVNIILDVIFVIFLGWGVSGVAFASLLGEYCASAYGLWVVLGLLGENWRINPLWHRRSIKAMFRVNRDIFIRTLCLTLGFFYFTAQGAQLGEIILAANAVLMHFFSISAHSLDGFAHAAEALAGNAYGARNRQALRTAVRISSIWALIFAGIFALVYSAFGSAIIGMITSLDEVRANANHYLPWLLLMPLVSVWSFLLDGIFIGTTHSAEMRNAMVLSLFTFFIAVWMLLPLLGNHGLWLALMIFMAMRGITLGFYYPRIERALASD